MVNKIIKEIFERIDKIMEETKSNHPVPMKYSEFLRRYNKLKEEYLNEKSKI